MRERKGVRRVCGRKRVDGIPYTKASLPIELGNTFSRQTDRQATVRECVRERVFAQQKD